MDFVLIYRALVRKIWLILGVTIFAVALALILTIDYKKTYRSSAQLATGFTVAEQVSVVNEKFNLFEADVKFNNLIETINSPKVFSALSYELLLHDLNKENVSFRKPADTEEYRKIIANADLEKLASYTRAKLDSLELIKSNDAQDQELKDLLVAYDYNPSSLRESINVSRIRGTDYVLIEAFTENAELSAFMVNTLVDAFLRYDRSNRTQRSSESIQTFASLVNQKKQEMEEKAEELRQFKSSNRVLNFQMESSSIIEQITELENQYNEQQRKVEGLQYEIEDLNNRIQTVSNADNNNRSADLNSEIIALREDISELNNRFVASGSNDVILLDSLKSLRAKLQSKLIQTGSSGTDEVLLEELIKKRQDKQVELQIARQDLASIRTNLRLYKGNAGGYASKEATIAALERELNMATQEYQNAQEKYNTALDVALASGSNIRQILEAQPPDQPEPSKRLIITGLSGISTFVLCLIAIILMEYLDASVKTPSNFKKITGAKMAGILPYVPSKRRNFYDFESKKKKSKPSPQFLEMMRKIRFEIESTNKRVFLITSNQLGQGKTAFILSLARAFFNIKKRVLIVDTNFSNNELSRLLSVEKYLEDIPQKEDDLKEYITETKIDNVFILGCKGGNYSSTEILGSDNILKKLKQQKEFDYIFMEGPALNNFSDSKELENYAEGVINVFSAKDVYRQIDEESMEYLKNLHNKFVGVVLNKVEEQNIDH